MFRISKQLCLYTAILMLILSKSTFAETSVIKPSETKENLQNSKQAIQFFQHELGFKTNPHGIKQVIDTKDSSVTIIDVRSAKDYAQGHIPGAINIPYDKYNSFEGQETSFPGLRKDGYNYVYCYELLCDLAKAAAIKFASLGYPVKEIAGGFASWKQKEYPIEK